MLRHLDTYAKFDRSDNQQPFLLLDGHHHSRFDVPFLNYIHEVDHPWTVCVGVPYGTHIWQVADSSQINGKFKILLTKAKRQFYELKREMGKQFDSCDIIPLINACFDGSFRNATSCRKAIAERGWFPLNYVLLDHPLLAKQSAQVTATVSTSSSSEVTGTTNIHLLFPMIEKQHPTADIMKLNTSIGAAATATELLVADNIKNDRYMKNYSQRKRDLNLLADTGARLRSIARVASGPLATIKEYHLSIDLRNMVVERKTIEKNEKLEIEKKKINSKHETDRKYYQLLPIA